MAYTHDQTTDCGRLRTLLYDFAGSGVSAVFETHYWFEDADLDALIDEAEDDIFDAAAMGCRSLASKYAREAMSLGLGKGDISINKNQRAQFYLTLAAQYDRRSGSNVVEYIDSANFGTSTFGEDTSEYIGEE